ncbi:hypothetical protein DEU56DRAFT_752056 [Suillus clintonianus]|uniref:uncharacterized protein n=1 Tax=Suillus clintonianus TaxID=1904413 RepID=UPI001B86066E|nr:uncharacterized protein DEU56DRAFT_752056 [Suillus clintonianus]KAG2152749.1 hypothetical protein DEU56DRAFT_752056 [Suillus clintonianus]
MSYTFRGVFTNVGDKSLVLTLKDHKVTVAKFVEGDKCQTWEITFIGDKAEAPLLNKGSGKYIGWDTSFTEALSVSDDPTYLWQYGPGVADLVGGKFHFRPIALTVGPEVYSLVINKTKKTLEFVKRQPIDDYAEWTLSYTARMMEIPEAVRIVVVP